MNTITFLGLACWGTVCGFRLASPASAANITDSDSDMCYPDPSMMGCTKVHSELALILDGSASITNENFVTLKSIYSDVFRNSNFYDQIIAPLPSGKQNIAVSTFQFGYGGGKTVRQDIDWMVIDSSAAAATFADQLDTLTQMGGHQSPLGDAISYVTDDLRQNAYAGDYLIIDIASDGYAFLENVSWEKATIDAYWADINAINGISVNPATNPSVSPVLDNIVSLTKADNSPLIPSIPDAHWSNPSATVGFLSVTGNYNNYYQFLANKIAKETLPKDVYNPDKNYLEPESPVDVPEPSSFWGLLSFAWWGVCYRAFFKQPQK